MDYPYSDLPIIDAHVHIMEPASLIPTNAFLPPTPENAHNVLQILDACGYAALNIPAITLYDNLDLPCNPLSLYAKTLCPTRVYAFAGLRRELVLEKNADMLDQLRNLLDAGFDGVKMICKPNARKQFNVKINDAMFDDFYKYMEEHGIPLLFHIGDPAGFWDSEKVPDWARKNGWYYGDDKTIPNLDGMYAEVEAMLERFPALPVVFAHFYFMSPDLTRAAALFNKYSNISFDLTPGREMYEEFSKNPQTTREFFIKYQDRLIFGTDNIGKNGDAAPGNDVVALSLLDAMRRFFETDGEITHWQTVLRGLNLPKEVCRKIYAGNFLKLVHGKAPKQVNPEKARELCAEYLSLLGPQGDRQTKSVLESLRNAFS